MTTKLPVDKTAETAADDQVLGSCRLHSCDPVAGHRQPTYNAFALHHESLSFSLRHQLCDAAGLSLHLRVRTGQRHHAQPDGWAIARNGQLPASGWLTHISVHKVPANAIWTVAVVAAAFSAGPGRDRGHRHLHSDHIHRVRYRGRNRALGISKRT